MSEKPSVSGEMNFLASISLALGSMMTMGDMHTHLMLIAFELGQPLPLHGFGLHLQHADLRILLLKKLLQENSRSVRRRGWPVPA
jgi:hypothetical protein